MFQKSFEGVSREIEGCFNGVLSGSLGCLKEVHWLFEESFKMLQGCFKEVLGVFRETFKGDSMELRGI